MDAGTQKAAPQKLGTLKMSGLTSWHGPRLALDSLSLIAEPRLLTAIVGPACSGKSTLIRIAAGLQRPRGGSIELDGSDITRRAPHRRGFGVVLQPDILFPHLSLAENIAFPLRMRGTRRAAAHKLVANALDLVQLGQSGHAMPAEASPAERQRAMLARATVFAPKILLLDEPFSDQDAGSRGAMMASLRRIQQLLGATTLLATRNGNDALALADRLAVLRDGAIEQFGAPGEVFEHPRNDHVAAQLGEVNRLAGQVQSIDADIALIRLACGPRVEAQCGRALHQGDPCVVTLRPDRIALASIPAAEMGGNALDATLLEANFEGDSYRLRLLIGSGTELIARRPAAAGLRGFSPNAAVSVAWQAHHASAFRAS